MISITKILITIAVVIGVAVVFRNKPRPGTAAHRDQNNGDQNNRNKVLPNNSTTAAASNWVYILATTLILAGVVVFYFKWHADNQIVTIRVIDGDTKTVYQAYQKNVKGKQFTTLDGREVTIGENQNMETTVQ